MRRRKIGDLYCAKVPGGYKLFQFAYRIPKDGSYFRVFGGLYEKIPEDLTSIVEGPHSYIISIGTGFFKSRMVSFLSNFPVPEKYPYPKFRLKFWMNQWGEIFCIWLTPNDKSATGSLNKLSFDVTAMKDLPEEYREIKLLSSYVTPIWLVYLFDCDFDLNDLNRFWPQTVFGDSWESKMEEYTKLFEESLPKQ